MSDPYVKRSKREGYRSRSAYKLIEIDARDRLFRPGQVVVDLGDHLVGEALVADEDDRIELVRLGAQLAPSFGGQWGHRGSIANGTGTQRAQRNHRGKAVRVSQCSS